MTIFLVVLAALAAAATSTPVTINIPETAASEKEMVAAMTKMADNFLNWNNEVELKEPEGNFEMRFSGFSGVIKRKSKTDQDQESTAKKDVPVAEASSEEKLTVDSFDVKKVPSGYKRLGSGSYKFHDDRATWLAAKATCEREGAHLVVINSEEEAQLVGDLFSQHTYPNVFPSNQIWVGANDIEEEGHFVTVLGGDLSSAGYTTWFENQPDDWKDENPSGEDCITMRLDKLLNDLTCTARLAFVCEIAGSGLNSTSTEVR